MLAICSAHIISLTHWGRVTHICVSKLTIIDSDNGLSPGRRQAIIWTNTEILLIWPYGTNFSEISIDIKTFSFKKIHSKMSSGKWRPFCLGVNVLNPKPISVFLRWRRILVQSKYLVLFNELYLQYLWSNITNRILYSVLLYLSTILRLFNIHIYIYMKHTALNISFI